VEAAASAVGGREEQNTCTRELSAAFSAGAAPRSREDIGSNAGLYGAERRECAIFFRKWQVLPPLLTLRTPTFF
jgi:hypothetical protein